MKTQYTKKKQKLYEFYQKITVRKQKSFKNYKKNREEIANQISNHFFLRFGFGQIGIEITFFSFDHT